MKRTTWIAAGFLLAASLLVRPSGPQDSSWEIGLNKIEDIEGIIKSRYYKDVGDIDMAQETIKGMLQTLDPHSYFLEPESFARMAEEQRGKYYGVGMQIVKQEDRLMVVSPLEGTPAWRLGIQAGDVVTHINGESTKPISDLEAVSKLRGPKGTKVRITLAREKLEKPIELTVEREEIPLRSVAYSFMLDDGIGYIFIRYFAEATADELEEKLQALAERGMKGLILDLRGNAGGALSPAVEISDEFLPRGELVVSMKGRNRSFDHEFPALRDDQFEKLPLVVLINQGSASASEIVAGAVMDNDRGLIVGEDSWGKGLVQQLFPLAPEMAVALTIAKYYTPSGRSIQRDYSRLDDYIMDKIAQDKPREVRYTVKGRKVLGQGGITPDVTVAFNMPLYVFELRSRGALFAYARKYVTGQTALSRTASAPVPGAPAPAVLFQAAPEVLNDFRSYLQAGAGLYDAARFKEAEADLKRELEREINSALYGQEAGWRAFERSDPQVLKALQLMPEAAKFVK